MNNGQPLYSEPSDRFTAVTNSSDFTTLKSSGKILGFVANTNNENPDYNNLKTKGIQFIYLKAPQGNGTNPNFTVSDEAATKAGLAVGLYHYFSSTKGVDSQIHDFETLLTNSKWNLPPMIDCENLFNNTIDTNYKDQVIVFAKAIQAKFHISPIIYTYPGFADTNLDQRAGEYGLYVGTLASDGKVASPRLPKWWKTYLFSQYDKSGNVEFDMFNGSSDDFARLKVKR